MNVVATAVQHALAKLRADTELGGLVDGIFEGAAPEGAGHPLVLVQMYGDPTIRLYNGSTVAMGLAQVSVRAVASHETLDVLMPIVDRIATALHGSHGTYPTGTVTACARTREQYLVDGDDRYVGYLFDITVS